MFSKVIIDEVLIAGGFLFSTLPAANQQVLPGGGIKADMYIPVSNPFANHVWFYLQNITRI